ncbi:MAG TPA: PEP-CTERM sorting domain-containing protein [Ferrovibrio sp.]|uniref:PEP-CTERM sorting domain-containing protein n=1 Tax=Ferrovibrio sp. TaxID=1917215 RepID=UPI002ED1908F
MRRLGAFLFGATVGVVALGTANAAPVLSFGAGGAVTSADRTATFDSVTGGTDLSAYTEDSLSITVPDTAYVSFDPDGAATSFSGGFHFVFGGHPRYTAITTTDGERMSGVEFALGSGFVADLSDTIAAFAYEVLRDGSSIGSGFLDVALGTIVGISDDLGFDELRIGAYANLAAAETGIASNTLSAIAIDNVVVQLAGGEQPPSQVPEPGSLALFGAGLAALGLIRRRR